MEFFAKAKTANNHFTKNHNASAMLKVDAFEVDNIITTVQGKNLEKRLFLKSSFIADIIFHFLSPKLLK